MSSPPRRPYTEEEIQKLYPINLELQQVQIFFRHGERSPTSARFENTGLAAFWPYCSSANQNQLSNVTIIGDDDTSRPSTLRWRRQLETFDFDGKPVIASDSKGKIDGMCSHGQLTDQGWRSSYALGLHLRHLYVDQLEFLPSTISDPEMIYLRTTRIPRALESLQGAFCGIYPQQFQSKSFPPPAIVWRAATEETLNPNDSHCRRFAQLARAFSQRTAKRWNTSTEMDYLNNLIGKWMPDNSKRIAIDSRPQLSGIWDTIASTLAHGPETRLPKDFYDQKGMAIMNRLLIEESFSGYSESHEYRVLGIGSLMGDIVSRMILSVERDNKGGLLEVRQSNKDLPPAKGRRSQSPIKLGLSGCHDSTIASILTSLGAFKFEWWPPYTSHIALELFREAETPEDSAPRGSEIERLTIYKNTIRHWPRHAFGLLPGAANDKKLDSKANGIPSQTMDTLPLSERPKLDGYYVRIRYDGIPVTIPGCKALGKHLEGDESFCTLEAFKAIVDKFTPLNWKQDCWSNMNGPAFPAKPEPAGY
ncbi:hypothetical protein NHQ30_000128 [Ciborinia camelliae]|nr:hypothetical protein NHQ30_000128 [Ciborinia camelliae]